MSKITSIPEEFSIQYEEPSPVGAGSASVYSSTQITNRSSQVEGTANDWTGFILPGFGPAPQTGNLESEYWGDSGFPSGLGLPGVSVPESIPLVMLMVGLIGLAICGRKRR